MFIGLFFIIIGALWVLSNIGLIHASIGQLWPVILIAIGFQILWDHSRKDKDCCKKKDKETK